MESMACDGATLVGAPIDYNVNGLDGTYAAETTYNFESSAVELARAEWPNYDDQHYLRSCRWSPDGTCLLTVVRGAGTHVFELPGDLYSLDSLMTNRLIHPLVPAVSVPESGLIYDYCWYPGMHSGTPATCCWAATGHEGPIHLWDAYSGELRCSYRGYNNLDELEAAISVTFSADGQNIFCGYKKNIKIFSTSRPGREFVEYPITYPASCIVASLAQPGVVAIGTWKNTIELVSQSDGSFRHLCKLQGHRGGITTMVFSRCGTRLYSGARKDKDLICWDLRVPGRPLFTLTRESNTNQKIALDLSRNDKWLASGGTDGKVMIWNVEEQNTPTQSFQMPLHQDCVNGVSLHPFKPVVATSCGQHQTEDPLHHSRKNQACENALAMFWIGDTHEDPYYVTSIIKAATNI